MGPFGAHFGPPNGLGSPKSEGGTGQNGPKGGQQAIKMCFGTVSDHLEAILVHFQPKLEIRKILRFCPFWAILGRFWTLFGPFWVHFGPPNGLGSLKMQGGTGQNGPKGGQQAIKMCFETVLHHLEAIGPHLKAEKKIKKKYFLTFF